MNEQPKKKKHSLWWIWLILILAAFAGGIVTGLKLNTLPLPSEVQGKLYPILESYIPGSTKTRDPKPAAETAAPEASVQPAAEMAAPEASVQPAAEKPASEASVQPAAETPTVIEETEMLETPKPDKAEIPVETAEAKPIESLSPAVAEPPAEAEVSEFKMSEDAAFAAEPQAVKYIGVNKALEIALLDANPGERKAEVSGVYRTKDDDGNPVYEVSFMIDEIGYDYVIDAVSGEIMSWRLSGLSFSETFAFGEGQETDSAELLK